MIDIAKSMNYLTTSKEDQARDTKYQDINMNEILLDGKKQRNAKYDLIFNSYIDPATMRHMSIPTVQEHDSAQLAMQSLLRHNNASNSGITSSSVEKKRFRLPAHECSTTVTLILDVVQQNAGSCNLQTDHTTFVEDVRMEVENDESTYTSKRVKRSNDRLLNEISMREEEWNFVPYPNHNDVEKTLSRFFGISQLLTSWDQLLYDNRCEDTSIIRRTDDVGPGYIDDVEHALLDFHVTSDDWNANTMLSTSTAKGKHRKSHALTKNNGVLPSNASSVSSISFLEHLHVPPPTLLRVTTSKILEEQEFLWKQIKQETNEPCPAPFDNDNSFWHHEVTRGHHVRPMLSPPSLHCNYYTTALPSARAQELERELARTRTDAPSLGFKTPTSEERQMRKVASEPQIIVSSTGNTSCPVQVTPTKEDRNGKLVSKSLYAPCVECGTNLHLPRVAASSVMYCINCGVIASTDLMSSFVEIDDE
jgi:hypothetical protein